MRDIYPQKVLKLVIVGGAEAWTVADKLQAHNASVLLRPARCTPGSWETRRCLLPNNIGQGLDFELSTGTTSPKLDEVMFPAAHILMKAGVKVGVSFSEDNFARGLIWEAGWVFQDAKSAARALKQQGMSAKEALGMITWNVADMFGIKAGRLVEGELANVLVYNSDPIEGAHGLGSLHSRLEMIVDGTTVRCHPRQL